MEASEEKVARTYPEMNSPIVSKASETTVCATFLSISNHCALLGIDYYFPVWKTVVVVAMTQFLYMCASPLFVHIDREVKATKSICLEY